MDHPRTSRRAWGCAACLGGVAWLLLGADVHAQEAAPSPPEPVVLTVEEALLLGLGRSEELEVAEAGVLRSEGELLRARSGYWPQLQGEVGYTRTFLSEYDEVFQTQVPPEAEVEGFEDIPFGQDNTYRATVSMSWTVYQGGAVRAQHAMARAGQDAALLSLTQAEAEVAVEVASAYYDAVLARRLAEVSAESVDLARRVLEQAEIGLEVGAQPAFDVLRARVDVARERVDLVQAARQATLAELALRQRLDLPADVPLVLGTGLSWDPGLVRTAEAALDPPPLSVPEARAPVREAAEVVEMYEASVRVARSQWLPRISVSGLAGIVTYPETLLPPLDPGQWREDLYTGVALQVPLFTGFRIRGEVRTAEADLLESRARLEQTREAAELDTRGVLTDLEAARARVEATSGTAEQAREAYQLAALRFREGVSAQVEVSDARLLLREALVDEAQAVRDLQLAELRVLLLPLLPLTVAGGEAEPIPEEPPLPPSPPLREGPPASAANPAATP